MRNKIYIKGIEIYAYHGVFPEETCLGQKFIFDIEASLDFKNAMFTDELDQSVSYADIAKIIEEVSTNNTYKLLERLAFKIAETIFERHKLIDDISLTIDKPNAPVKQLFKECGVFLKISRRELEELI